MHESKRVCYISVSDLALCQKCPMLLAYKIHMGKKSAWRVGIHGNGNAYGSIFHRHISRVFFEAASEPYHPLHENITHAVSAGGFELESIIRENIFMPFVEQNSERFTSGQIIAMAKGVTVWVKAMSEFFMSIPSLARYSESNMQLIFAEPEQRLKSHFDFHDGRIYITGRYDALMFNPDRREERLFEFKGYMKSDITVPLSQSLIYSWLIWRDTGIIPSVEIIYLDEEDKQPDIFDSQSICSMMSPTLPELFYSAFNILTLRRKPEILQDKDICYSCKYRKTCRQDMTNLFMNSKRTGASLVNVLVFFLVALMITAQAFFFLSNSAESVAEEREMMQIQLKLDELVDEGKYALLHVVVPNETSPCIGLISKDYHGAIYKIKISKDKYIEYGTDFYLFRDGRNNQDDEYDSKTKLWENTNHDAAVFDLNYYFLCEDDSKENDISGLAECMANITDEYVKIFPPLGKNYFLIRARVKLSTGNYIMRQVVIKKDGTDLYTRSSEEVYYW
ncbi:MAG: hypothetical protein IJG34_08455 [Synergistaceae bacterium]|nr:hypothetical protein [Synergistaceae bacterium]